MLNYLILFAYSSSLVYLTNIATGILFCLLSTTTVGSSIKETIRESEVLYSVLFVFVDGATSEWTLHLSYSLCTIPSIERRLERRPSTSTSTYYPFLFHSNLFQIPGFQISSIPKYPNILYRCIKDDNYDACKTANIVAFIVYSPPFSVLGAFYPCNLRP